MTDYDPRLDKPVYDDVVMTPKAPAAGSISWSAWWRRSLRPWA